MGVMHEQIANYMRVCVAIGDGIESLRGVASSEPILSEAASYIMSSKDFSLPVALSHVLGGYCINQGDRGELVVSSFFTWARDQVVRDFRPIDTRAQLCPHFKVTDLFGKLFSESAYESTMKCSKPSLCASGSRSRRRSRRKSAAGATFEDAFKHAHMHFNHVIKPYEHKALTRLTLLAFMVRGAAAIGANGQPGFDAVYPYLTNTTQLDIDEVGFIIVQVKNNPDITVSQRGAIDDIFLKMDPFSCHLIDDSDKVDGLFPVPIIRILFLLSAEPGFTQWTYGSPSQGSATVNNNKPLFTSYDYVCCGVDAAYLGPPKESPSTWQALVNKREGWSSFFGATPDALRYQLPGTGYDERHFTRWLEEGRSALRR
jgi:hypothetical protein